jgi:hypothetical protein
MASKIETLTPEQLVEMRLYREDQRREALRTDKIDPDAARSAVSVLYATAGLPAPKYMIVLDSPVQCLMARGLMRLGNNGDQLRDQLWAQLRDQLWAQLGGQLGGQLGDQLWDQLGDQLGGQLWDQLWDQLWAQLGGQLRDQLWDQLRAQLGGQLRDQLWGQLRAQLGDQLRAQLWGQLGGQLGGQLYQQTFFVGGWDAFWLAFYDYARKIGVKYPPKTDAALDAYRAYAAACGVSYLYPGAAFISDRPDRILFDHMRRLHADDGPALRWRDGYGIYAWHGMRIPADLIDRRHEMTPKSITAIANAEHRRAAIEIYAHVHGPDKFVKDLGATIVSSDKCHGRPRRLYRLGDQQWVHVINGSKEPDGTRREFLLGVPNDVTTPHEAVAWSYGRPVGKYKEAVRT